MGQINCLHSRYSLIPKTSDLLIGDVLLKPIIECAGNDISHWFDPKKKDVRHNLTPFTADQFCLNTISVLQLLIEMLCFKNFFSFCL